MTNQRFLAYPATSLPLARQALALLGRLWGWLGREMTLRRDIRHLERLDETQLADLGLTRGAIVGAVRGHHDPHA